jgi:hypothetical protein
MGYAFPYFYLQKKERKVPKISKLIRHKMSVSKSSYSYNISFTLEQIALQYSPLLAEKISLDLISVPVWLIILLRPTKDQRLGKLLTITNYLILCKLIFQQLPTQRLSVFIKIYFNNL